MTVTKLSKKEREYLQRKAKKMLYQPNIVPLPDIGKWLRKINEKDGYVNPATDIEGEFFVYEEFVLDPSKKLDRFESSTRI